MSMRSLAAIVLLTVAPSLCFAQGSDAMKSMQGMDATHPTNPATAGYMREMAGMQDAMKKMTPTNDPNKDFVAMMKPHHQAAVEMAKTYLKYGNDPKLTAMAHDIVKSQDKEIEEMSAWQTKHMK